METEYNSNNTLLSNEINLSSGQSETLVNEASGQGGTISLYQHLYGQGDELEAMQNFDNNTSAVSYFGTGGVATVDYYSGRNGQGGFRSQERDYTKAPTPSQAALDAAKSSGSHALGDGNLGLSLVVTAGEGFAAYLSLTVSFAQIASFISAVFGMFDMVSGATQGQIGTAPLSALDPGLSDQLAATSGSDVVAAASAGSQSALGSASGQLASPFEGSRWQGDTVTWDFASVADLHQGPTPFSGVIASAQAEVVQQAMQTWSAASGLTFVQTADGQAADLTIGWGDFQTASSGVLGYTSGAAASALFSPGLSVRMEDPNEMPLITNDDGQLAYFGTNAELCQVVLHEIGHALGLADNADPNSIMYYGSGGQNRGLDATDLTNIHALYATALATDAYHAVV